MGLRGTIPEARWLMLRLKPRWDRSCCCHFEVATSRKPPATVAAKSRRELQPTCRDHVQDLSGRNRRVILPTYKGALQFPWTGYGGIAGTRPNWAKIRWTSRSQRGLSNGKVSFSAEARCSPRASRNMRRARCNLDLTVSGRIPSRFAVSSPLTPSTSRRMNTVRKAGGRSSMAHSRRFRI